MSDRPGSRLSRPPAWLARESVLITALFAVGVLAYLLVVRTRIGPLVPNDEYDFGNLAQSVALGDGYRWRGTDVGLRSVYPLLIAPAWMLSDGKSAYDITKAINVVTMCTAVWPTWLAARTVIRGRWALLPPALLLLGIWMAYAGNVMTEALAFPAAACALCFGVLALQRSSGRWLAGALVAALVGAAARPQLGSLFAILGLALVVDVLRFPRAEWRLRARERRGALLTCWAINLAGLILVLGPLRDGTIGGYTDVVSLRPSLGQSARVALDHGVELALMVGVIPMVLATALLFSRRAWRDARLGPLLAIFAPAVLVLLAFAGWFQAGADGRIIERYVAYLVPLVLIGAVVGARRAGWRQAAVATAALTIGALVMNDPSTTGGALAGSSESPSFFIAGMDILGWAKPTDGGVAGVSVLVAALGVLTTVGLWLRDGTHTTRLAGRTLHAGTLAAAAGLAIVGIWLVNASRHQWKDGHTVSRAYADAYFQGQVPDAVDRVAGGDKTLVGLAVPDTPMLWIEFFNKRIKDMIVQPGGQQRAGYGPACTLTLAANGDFARGTRCAGGPRTMLIVAAPTEAIPTLRDGGPLTSLTVPRGSLVKGSKSFLAIRQPLCTAGTCGQASIQTWAERPSTLRLRFTGGTAAHRFAVTKTGEAPKITPIPPAGATTVAVKLGRGKQTLIVQGDWQFEGADTPSLSGITLREQGRPPVRIN